MLLVVLLIIFILFILTAVLLSLIFLYNMTGLLELYRGIVFVSLLGLNICTKVSFRKPFSSAVRGGSEGGGRLICCFKLFALVLFLFKLLCTISRKLINSSSCRRLDLLYKP